MPLSECQEAGAVGLLFGLMATIAGCITVHATNQAGWLTACGVLTGFALTCALVTGKSTYIVVATGIWVYISWSYAQAVHDLEYPAEVDEGKVAGYCVLSAGIVLCYVSNISVDALKRLPLHPVAIVLFLINLAGCVVLFKQTTELVLGKQIGIPALINGFIFLVGVTTSLSPSDSACTTGGTVSLVSVATCINIFYSALSQFSWLMAVFMMYNGRSTAPVAGISIIWAASWLFVAYNMYTMTGSALNEAIATIKPRMSSPRAIVLLITLVASIIAAACYNTVSGDDNVRFIFSNAIFVSVFLLAALITDGDRKIGWALMACGVTIGTAAYTVFYTNAMYNNLMVAYGNNQIVCILMLVCMFAAWLAYGINDSIKHMTMGISDAFRMLALILACIGLIFWFLHEDSWYGITLGTCMLTFGGVMFIVGAYYFQPYQQVKSVAIFFVATQGVIQLSAALVLINRPSSSDGVIMSFVASLVLVLAYLYEGHSPSKSSASLAPSVPVTHVAIAVAMNGHGEGQQSSSPQPPMYHTLLHTDTADTPVNIHHQPAG